MTMPLVRPTSTGGATRSILVIQTKYIGDVVLSSALTIGLRRAFPGARVDMVCESHLADFVHDNGIADGTIGVERAKARGSIPERLAVRLKLLRQVRAGRYDLSIDIADSTTSQLAQWAVGAPVRVSYDPPEKRPVLGFLGRPWTHPCPRYGTSAHYVDRYLAPLTALGADADGLVPRLTPSPARQAEADALLAANGLAPGGFVAVHAGARTEPRRWPPERFAAVLAEASARHGLKVALVGGPDERELSQTVADGCGGTVLAGRLPLAALPALMSRAGLFVGNESGPMHIAAAVGVPVVGLFGLTDPAVWGPVSERAAAIRPPMPCACVRPGVCVSDDTNKAWCVTRIGEAEVARAIDRVLGES